jgi:hypothetical protein
MSIILPSTILSALLASIVPSAAVVFSEPPGSNGGIYTDNDGVACIDVEIDGSGGDGYEWRWWLKDSDGSAADYREVAMNLVDVGGGGGGGGGDQQPRLKGPAIHKSEQRESQMVDVDGWFKSKVTWIYYEGFMGVEKVDIVPTHYVKDGTVDRNDAQTHPFQQHTETGCNWTYNGPSMSKPKQTISVGATHRWKIYQTAAICTPSNFK